MNEDKTLNDYSPEEIEKARQALLRRETYGLKYRQEHKDEQRVRNRNHYETHRTETLEHSRQYVANNKEKVAAYQLQYDLEHKKTKKAYDKKRFQKRRDEILLHHKKYNEENKEERKAYMAQHYQENKAAIKARSAKYYREHPELQKRMKLWYHNHKEGVRAYRETHKDTIKAQMRKWNRDNRGKRNASALKYRQTHPEAHKASHRNDRARRRGAEGSYTQEEWTLKLQEYDNSCVYCDTPTEATPEGTLTPDHLTPIARGGTNYISNIAPACLQCNMEKNDMTAEEFINSIDAGDEEGVLVRRYLSEHPEEVERIAKENDITLRKEDKNGELSE